MLFKIFLLTAALEMGIVNGILCNYTRSTPSIDDINPLYTSLEADVSISLFYVGGKMLCYFVPDVITNYVPFQMTFVFNAGIKFDSVKIGYEHSCFHPMQTYASIIDYEIKPKYEGGYNRFFIRFSTK